MTSIPSHILVPECHLQGVYKQKNNKSNTPFQVLITLIDIFKILKCSNSKIQKVQKYKPTLL
jgi:hypothetical protein